MSEYKFSIKAYQDWKGELKFQCQKWISNEPDNQNHYWAGVDDRDENGIGWINLGLLVNTLKAAEKCLDLQPLANRFIKRYEGHGPLN